MNLELQISSQSQYQPRVVNTMNNESRQKRQVYLSYRMPGYVHNFTFQDQCSLRQASAPSGGPRTDRAVARTSAAVTREVSRNCRCVGPLPAPCYAIYNLAECFGIPLLTAPDSLLKGHVVTLDYVTTDSREEITFINL